MSYFKLYSGKDNELSLYGRFTNEWKFFLEYKKIFSSGYEEYYFSFLWFTFCYSKTNINYILNEVMK